MVQVEILTPTRLYVAVVVTEMDILSNHTKQFLDITTNGDLPRILLSAGRYHGFTIDRRL